MIDTFLKLNIAKNRSVINLIKNFISISVLRFADVIIPFLITPYIIATVGVKNYGIYGFSSSLILYMLNVTQYGFSLSAVREISINRDDAITVNRIFNEVMTVKLILTIMMFLMLVVLLFYVPMFGNYWRLYIFGFLLLVADCLTPIWFFQGIEKLQTISIINILSRIGNAILVFILIKDQEDFIYIPLYQFLSYMIAAFASIYIIVRNYKIKFYWCSIKSTILQLKKGFSTFITLISPTLYSNTSTFLLGFFSDPFSVAYFVGASKICAAFVSLNDLLTQVMYPFVNKNKGKIKYATMILLISGLFVSLIMFITAPISVALVLGKEMQSSVVIVYILSISPFLLGVRSAFGVNQLLVYKKDALYMNIAIFSSVIGLISSLFLIKSLNYYGAAITIITSQLLFAGFTFYYSKKI
jgi:PST family polysaccharide transporter